MSAQESALMMRQMGRALRRIGTQAPIVAVTMSYLSEQMRRQQIAVLRHAIADESRPKLERVRYWLRVQRLLRASSRSAEWRLRKRAAQ